MNIRLDDNVLVIAGKNRGKSGKVTRVLPKHNKVVVEKINIRTKHIKKKPGVPGQRIRFEAPIHVSNVQIICPNCEKKTRISMLILKTGSKQRICKKCSQSLDKPVERKHTKKR